MFVLTAELIKDKNDIIFLMRLRKEQQPPFSRAMTERERIEQALERGIEYQHRLSPATAACILGISAEVLRKSALGVYFYVRDGSLELLVANEKTAAFEALWRWAESRDESVKSSFREVLYRGVYTLLQASLLNLGREAITARGPERFLWAIFEAGNPKLEGLGEVIRKQGFVVDQDLPAVQQALEGLWSQLTPGQKESLRKYPPENLSTVL